MPTVIYISGKISNLPTMQVRDKFEAARASLESNGYKVLSPTDITPPTINDLDKRMRLAGVSQQEAEWEYYMEHCWHLLTQCDTIYMLRDWRTSRGARLEFDVAVAFGKKVMFE
ncbi:MAG: DUF4406 domain-containing protein [Bacteroidales bacterium]